MQVLLKTWICASYPECPFKWQFSGEAIDYNPQDMTESDLMRQFPEKQFIGLTAGKCPNCFMQQLDNDLYLPTDLSLMSKATVAEDSDIEAEQVKDLDDNGQLIMVESGDYADKLINDNGTAKFVQEPVMIPKMREQTKQEIDAKTRQRDEEKDKLEPIIVKDITNEVIAEADPEAV